MARNQDDHTKNLAFQMDRRGDWSLAPAFDLTFAFNPSGAWTHRHQMSLAGKREGFTRDDLLAAASAADLKPRQARDIVQRVHEAAAAWPAHAEIAGVPSAAAQAIGGQLRLDLTG